MSLSYLVFYCAAFCLTCGFLLDDRSTPPSSGAGISQQQFNLMMDTLAEERRARLMLSATLEQVKKELLATQTGVTETYHNTNRVNSSVENKATEFEKRFTDLQAQYNSLQTKFDELLINNNLTESHSKKINQSIATLMKLKNVNDLQAVLNVQNKTKYLEQELQLTNNRLSAISSQADARKQDFIALYNTEQRMEHNLDTSVKKLEASFNQTITDINNDLNEMQLNSTVISSTMSSRINVLEGQQNLTERRLDREIHAMSDRVALTACAADKVYATETILFPFGHVSDGVSETIKSTLKSTGKFKCEKAGLYLVSVYIMSDKTGAVYIYKNSNYISFGYSSVNDRHQTSTSVVLTHFNINDTVSVQNEGSRHIWGDKFSCITFLQLTG